MEFQKKVLPAAISALAIAGATATPVAANAGEYRSGDFHNHTVCSDGSTSVRTLTRQALDYHDWFIHVGHSGRGPRDCRVEDFLYHSLGGGSRVGLWTNTLEPEEIKGDIRTRDFTLTSFDGSQVVQTVQDMWRWQSLQEFNMGGIIAEREAAGNEDKVAFLGLEWVVPGHEHASNAMSTGQYDEVPDASAIAQFEYCFARNSDDTSGGGGQGWSCELSEEANNKLIALFDGRPEEGIADYNSTLVGGINTDDNGEHVKAVAAALWMAENYPGEGFTVQAHVERQGAFLPDQNRGWNVEHMRDMHSVAPDEAFGFESQPGHQAQFNRGSYSGGRPTAGFWTYGGTGAYSAAEVSRPGVDFEGNPIDPATCAADENCSNIPRTVLSRPGIRTMWDALLSEGRKFWFFGSSDWHNRGAFGPLDFESTNDFWPGEYQDNFTYVEDENPDNPAQDVVDALRSGNTFVVQGQLITEERFVFEACSNATGECATMGETLTVPEGSRVLVRLNVTDPDEQNRSPYGFDNPALLQVGIRQPLDYPELAHVELIQGAVTGLIEPTDPEYYNPVAPETTRIVRQWTSRSPVFSGDETKRFKYRFVATEDSYLRARGSNLPPGTPYKRDLDGNPLADNLTDNIACSDPACPPHIEGVLNADVEAWADIWFHTNPVFIEVE